MQGLGLLSKRCRAHQEQMVLLWVCEPLRDFIKVYSRSQNSPFLWNKSLKTTWVGPQVGRGEVSGKPLGGTTCVIQVDGAYICRLEVGRAQQKNYWLDVF